MKSFKEILESCESVYDPSEALIRNAERLGIDSSEFVAEIIEEFYSENLDSEILNEFLGTAAVMGAGALGAHYLNKVRNSVGGPERSMQLMQQLQQAISADPSLKQQLGGKLDQINQMLVQAQQAKAQGKQPDFTTKVGSALGQVKNWWNNLGQDQSQQGGSPQGQQGQQPQQGSTNDPMMSRWNQHQRRNAPVDPNSMTGKLSQWQQQQMAKKNNSSVYA